MFLVSAHDYVMQNPRSECRLISDYPVHPTHNRLRNREAKLLGGLETDHQLELRRSFYRQLSRLGPIK